MTEIPQWRRKIPASRSRTPMLEVAAATRPRTPILEVIEPENDRRPTSATPFHPPTPKKGLRPKLSSYWSHNGPFNVTRGEPANPVDEPLSPCFPSRAVEDSFPNPVAEQLIDSIMCRLMSEPYKSLDSRFNGILLQIFEAYRTVSDERDRAEARTNEERCGRLADKSAMQRAEQEWEDERLAFKAEVKRLELIIAKEKRGVAAVAQARQDSIIRRRKQMESPEGDDRDDGKETVIQFLEKTRMFEDPAWSSQRATMRVRPTSPSMKMTKLSRKLNKKTSKTSIHADLADLPFGTPPEMPATTSLLVSFLEDQSARLQAASAEESHVNACESRPSLSDDTQSTFSCAGDLLPDEVGERGHSIQAASAPALSPIENELVELRRIAVAVSRRRGVSAESIMPKLIELFNQSSYNEDTERSDQQGLGIPIPRTGPSKVAARKTSNLMGFINKLRPQLTLNTPTTIDRRFSFEVGDDRAAVASAVETAPNIANERLLRKSVSLPTLPDVARRTPVATAPADLSPVEASPTASEFRRMSKIPSPSYGNLARPRQDRDDSMSSLLTAIKHSENTVRSSSGASSVYSNANSTNHSDKSKRQRSSGSSFIDHARVSTHKRRGDPADPVPEDRSGPAGDLATTAAMRAMCSSPGRSAQSRGAETIPIFNQQRYHKRGNIAERSGPSAHVSKENARPVAGPSLSSDDDTREGY